MEVERKLETYYHAPLFQDSGKSILLVNYESLYQEVGGKLKNHLLLSLFLLLHVPRSPLCCPNTHQVQIQFGKLVY